MDIDRTLIPRRHADTETLISLAQTGARYLDKHTYSLDKGYEYLRQPAEDISLVEQARTYLDKLMLDLPSTRQTFDRHVVGAFPSAAAFAAGNPKCMMRAYPTEDDLAPITIYSNVAVSQKIAESRPELLLKRGAVLMALVIALSERRQVKVVCFHAGSTDGARNGSIVSWDVPTAPLVIAQITSLMARPEVIRQIALCANFAVKPPRENYNHGELRWLQGHSSHKANPDQMRFDLGAAPQDVIIPGLHVNDPMLADPIAWLNRTITEALKTEDSY